MQWVTSTLKNKKPNKDAFLVGLHNSSKKWNSAVPLVTLDIGPFSLKTYFQTWNT